MARKCSNCGKVGHTARNCFQPNKVAATFFSAMCTENRNDRRDFTRDYRQHGRRCNNASRSNNYGNYAHSLNNDEVKTVHENGMQCRAHDREGCNECLKPVQKCHAMLSSELTLKDKRKKYSIPRISNILRCLLPTAANNNLGSFGSHVSEVTISDAPTKSTYHTNIYNNEGFMALCPGLPS